MIDLVELMAALIIPNLMRLQRKHLDKKRAGTAHGKAKYLLDTDSSRSELVGKKKNQSKLQDNVDILKDVLSLMLEDCTGDAVPKEIDENLVKDLLFGYGEGNLAQDHELVREMVDVAKAGSGSTNIALSSDKTATGEQGAVTALLDLDAFVAALTSDVARKYDPGREKRRSTNFDDVWYHMIGCHKESIAVVQKDEEMCADDYVRSLTEETLSKTLRWCQKDRKVDEDEGRCETPQDVDMTTGEGMNVRRNFTGPAVDYTVDTLRTRFQIIFLWVAFVLFYVAYLFHGQAAFQPSHCGEDDVEAKIACVSTHHTRDNHLNSSLIRLSSRIPHLYSLIQLFCFVTIALDRWYCQSAPLDCRTYCIRLSVYCPRICWEFH